MKKVQKWVLVTVVFILRVLSALSGEEAGDNPYRLLQEDQGLTITGTRTEKRLQDTPQLTEIISKEEIDASGADSVHDVLSEYGILFASNGMGDYVALQGLGEGRILYLVNGRRIAGRIAQRLNGETLPLGNIERIEIVRGPQSALYGSEGIGGVINIITKEPEAAFSFKAALTNAFHFAYDDPDTDASPQPFDDLMPFRTQHALVNTNFKLGPLLNTLTLTGNRASFYYNEDKSRSILPLQYQGSAGWETAFSPRSWLNIGVGGSFMGMQSDDRTSASGDTTRYRHSRADGHIQADVSLADNTQFLINLYDNFYQRDKDGYTALDAVWRSGENYENENLISLEAQGVWSAFTHWTLLGGLEVAYTSMDKYNFDNNGSSQVGVDKEAVFLQAERAGATYSVIGGIRLERNAQFGLFAAPKISAMYYILPALRILGGAGIGYRAPSFSDLYQITDSTRYIIYPNPAMKPEYALSFNAGAEFAGPAYFAQVHYFYSEMFDEIHYFYRDTQTNEPVSFDTGQVEQNEDNKPIRFRDNLSRSRRFGFDAEGRVRFATYFFVSAGESFVFAYNVSDKEVLHDTPANTVKFKVGFSSEKLNKNPIYTYLGARFITPLEDGSEADRHQLILDYFFNLRLASHWTIHVSITNITGVIHYYYSREQKKWTGHGEKVGQTVQLGVSFEW
ncbi:MAG: TonB-dependent receptor [Treponema sp.]|jgi:outer membrane receptor for ferrienterochelin and colicins|nr:TonB-dependent receptor [Treponema sp.]